MKHENGMPLIAVGENRVTFIPRMMNRHGLITGATGTGKTVSLQVLTEAFSSMGVPVFLADVKGDLAGLCQPGGTAPKVWKTSKNLNLLILQHKDSRSVSGIFLAKRDIPSGLPSVKWGRCF